MDQAKDDGDPWSKRGIYVRLSKRRKELLLAHAKRLGHVDSPHRTLAALVEEMSVSGSASDPHVLASADGTDADRIEVGLARIESAVASMTASMEERTADLIARLGDALAPLGDLAHGNAAPAEPLAQWLAEIEIERGKPIQKVALMRSSWRSAKVDRDGALDIELRAELLNVDGQPLHPPKEGLVLLAAIYGSGPFASALLTTITLPVIMACKPSGRGRWSIEAFSTMSDGTIGESIATFGI